MKLQLKQRPESNQDFIHNHYRKNTQGVLTPSQPQSQSQALSICNKIYVEVAEECSVTNEQRLPKNPKRHPDAVRGGQRGRQEPLGVSSNRTTEVPFSCVM